MKKIFILLAMMAFSFTTLSARRMVSADAVVTDTINYVYGEESSQGVISFLWSADTTKSDGYYISLTRYDIATNSCYDFVAVAGPKTAFTIDGYPGILQCSSTLVLTYGDNYSTIGAQGASAEVVASWQTTWENSVDEGTLTLKPGLYVIFIEGIDVNFNTTEVEAHAFVEIAETTDGIEEIRMQNRSGKFIDTSGRLYIIKDNQIYSPYGNRIK